MSLDKIKHWEVLPSTGRHFDLLDGLRGVAILMVVCFHNFYFNPQSGLLIRCLGSLNGRGGVGVPIFFILSGFLISLPFFKVRATDATWYVRGYARRRAAKIIPPFYLSLIILTLYYLVRYSNLGYFWTALRWAVGICNFIPETLNFNSVYWSLIVEVQFYLILPLLFWLTRNSKLRQKIIINFGLLFVIPLLVRELTWPSDSILQGIKVQIGMTPSEYTFFLICRFPGQLDYFAWGVLFAGVWSAMPIDALKAKSEFRLLSLLGYVGATLLVTTIILGAIWINLFGVAEHAARWMTESDRLLIGVSGFLLLFFLFDPQCFGARILSAQWLRFIGVVSYEWFLFHLPLIWLFREMWPRTHGSLMLYVFKTFIPMGLSFLFAVGLYRYFSLPIMNRVRAGIKRAETPR